MFYTRQLLHTRSGGESRDALLRGSLDQDASTMVISIALLLQAASAAALCTPAATTSTFSSLLPALSTSVTKALSARGVTGPTPIQVAALPRAFEGESLVLHAETGSGKSLAFLLPALTRLGLAGATEAPQPDALAGKVLVVAPTRELAVQLANEAALVMPAPGAVQIVAVGAIPEAKLLLGASVIACTAPELLALLDSEGDAAGVVVSVLSQVRVLVLDELDTLLPVSTTFSKAAAKRRQAEHKKGGDSAAAPAELLVRAVVEASSAGDLQLLAASATVSRPVRFKLARVLRRDPLARWYECPPDVVRPLELAGVDLAAVPRAVVIPPGVRHFYMPLRGRVKLQRAKPAQRAKSGPKTRVTLKQKRALKAEAQRQAKFTVSEGETHPLFTSLQTAIKAVEPRSALVFLCRSSGLTVRRAAKELSELGLPAVPLHEAIGLEHAAPATLLGQQEEDGSSSTKAAEHGAGGAPEGSSLSARAHRRERMRDGSGKRVQDDGNIVDTSGALQARHRAVSEAFSAGLTPSAEATRRSVAELAANGERTPLLITFEDMARGLHFDAVDAVFILGMPDSPATYLHLAGRTGRQPVLEGTVVTICPGSSHEQLVGWGTRLGGIDFELLETEDDGADPAPDAGGISIERGSTSASTAAAA